MKEHRSEDSNNGKITPWLAFSVFSAVFGSSFLFGYNIGVMNAPQNVIGMWIRNVECQRNGNDINPGEGISDDLWCKELDLQGEAEMFKQNGKLNTIWALINSLIPGGAVIGCLSSSFFVTRYGPKKTLLLNNLVAIIAALLTSLSYSASSYEMLIVGRFVAGLNSGINAGVPPTYLTEIAPAKLRGALGSAHQLFVVTAIWISQIFGLPFILGNTLRWPILLGVAIGPSLFQLLTLPFCPESPNFLVFRKHDQEGARRALQKLRGTSNVDGELNAIRMEYEKIKDQPAVTSKDIIVDPFLRRILLITLVLMIGQQLSGIDAVMFYSTAIFRSAGLVGDNALYATIGMGAINVTMTIIALVLVEKAGRRTLLLIGYCGMVVLLILLTIFMLLFKSGTPDDSSLAKATNPFAWAAYASSASLVGVVIMFATGPGAIPWILMSEMFAQGPRAAATSMIAGTNRFFSLIVALSFPYLQAAINEYSFIIFAVLTVFFIVFQYFYVVETKGKSIDEIQDDLRSRMKPSRGSSVYELEAKSDREEQRVMMEK